MWIIFIKWCNWAIPTGHKVGVDWVEAARITFHTKALHLDTLKSGRASLQCFHKVGTALCPVSAAPPIARRHQHACASYQVAEVNKHDCNSARDLPSKMIKYP